MLEALMPAISDASLPPRDRLGLQNDLYALVSSCVPIDEYIAVDVTILPPVSQYHHRMKPTVIWLNRLCVYGPFLFAMVGLPGQ